MTKNKIDKSYTLSYTCNTEYGCSGCPVILYNHRVIGVHRGYLDGEKFNRATLLQYPIEEYLKKLKEKEKEKLKEKGKKNNVKEMIVIDDSKKITLIYKIKEIDKSTRVLGDRFVNNNKVNCKMIINKKKYELDDFIQFDKYNINPKNGELKITLIGINNIINASCMFKECISLQSLPDISEWDTKNVTNMNYMFEGCRILVMLKV